MKAVSIRTSMADESGRKRPVTIRISRLRENVFLVTFKEKGVPAEEAGSLETSSVEETATRQLENELLRDTGQPPEQHRATEKP